MRIIATVIAALLILTLGLLFWQQTLQHRLSAENLALRGEVGLLRNQLNQVTPVYTATLKAVVGKGQTLVTGGWAIEPGKRCFAFITPTIYTFSDPTNLKVDCSAQLVVLPDALMEQSGLRDYASQEMETSKWGLYPEWKTQALMKLLDDSKNVDRTPAPPILVGDGMPAIINLPEGRLQRPRIFIIPTIIKDGNISISLVAQVSNPP